MASHKVDRAAEDIRRELTDIFRSLRDERVQGMLSIVKVELAKDMSACKVYVSAMEGMEAAQRAVQGLTSAAGYIRRELGHRLTLRVSPQLSFIADNSIAHGADIARILNELHRE